MSLKYPPRGFQETSAAAESNEGSRLGEKLCSAQVKGWDCPLSVAVRCYGCGHLFDSKRTRSDVLCPCCQ